jgi:radical SAM superfamily enzyme YgiQ (UPF0313 family)
MDEGRFMSAGLRRWLGVFSRAAGRWQGREQGHSPPPRDVRESANGGEDGERVLVVCTHLRQGRTKRRSRHFMQPLSGLHVASITKAAGCRVTLYHEDWHGPYDTAASGALDYDLVFLTGLQADFDRMRQLSFHFRRSGATVIAGGSICTLFPEFAERFFDAVCAGGVDAVAGAIADWRQGALMPVYRSISHQISAYEVDYSIFADAGVSPTSHLIEASRGCSFRCSFCVIPAEGAKHASFRLDAIARAIDSAIAASPRFSFRRWCSTIFFLDNNFADNRPAMLRLTDMLRADRRIRGWGALVTQNVLHDRPLLERLSASKCRMLFIGLESLDQEFLRRYNKTQNLSARRDIMDDVRFAERCGIAISYGILFDPRMNTVAEMRAQIEAIVGASGFPMPTYFSMVSPLAGTQTFWDDAGRGSLAPNLLLRDLDGETVAYADAHLLSSRAELTDFAERIARRPWTLVKWHRVLASLIKRVAGCGRLDPLHWLVLTGSTLHSYMWSFASPGARTSYFAGDDVLDPQYAEHPDDISLEDRQRYFEPVRMTDAEGRLEPWLEAYRPAAQARSKIRRAKTEAVLSPPLGEVPGVTG